MRRDISPCCESAAASAAGGHVKARERTQSACPVRLQTCTNLPPGGASANLMVQSTPPSANSSLQNLKPLMHRQTDLVCLDKDSLCSALHERESNYNSVCGLVHPLL